MPIGGAGLGSTLPVLHRAAEDAGRDPSTIEIMVFAAAANPGSLGHYRDLGVERAVLGLPSASEAVVLPLLDEWTKLL
jgi:hypothetical protein